MADEHNDFTASAGKWMIVLTWIIVLGLLTLLFSNIIDKKRNPNQRVVTQQLADGSKEIVLKSSRFGHYVANGKINGQEVVFLVDTGASFVSVPGEVADRIGLVRGAPITAMTANGEIRVYATTLDTITIGDITLYDVRADINPFMNGKEILLGMSFLRNLSVSHADGYLTIRQ